jgi:two-component sensor histidine kinase
MSLVHEKLYQAEDLAHIDFSDYIEDMVDYLLMVYGDRVGQIVPRLELQRTWLMIDTAIPCGLIVNELVSNALKHAFVEERETPEIRVSFETRDGHCLLVVSDNGIGLPPDVDIEDSPSLGLQLVKILTGQLQGTIDIDRDEGTIFNLSFPERKLVRGERT